MDKALAVVSLFFSSMMALCVVMSIKFGSVVDVVATGCFAAGSLLIGGLSVFKW